jgi:hypothetical protein
MHSVSKRYRFPYSFTRSCSTAVLQLHNATALLLKTYISLHPHPPTAHNHNHSMSSFRGFRQGQPPRVPYTQFQRAYPSTTAPAKRASKPTTAPATHHKTLARNAKAKHAVHSAPTKPSKHPKKRYTYSTCLVEKSSGFFAAYTPSAKCVHSIHTCNLCLKKYVNMRISEAAFKQSIDLKNATNVFGIGCPECKETMLSANVKAATTQVVFRRFEAMEHKYVASHIPGWRWCMAPNCSAGQVHKEAGGICTCRACGARACVPCDVPYHAGETCAGYKARMDQQHAVENTKSVAEIQVITRPCPYCLVKIQKNGGCGSVSCKYCDETRT